MDFGMLFNNFVFNWLAVGVQQFSLPRLPFEKKAKSQTWRNKQNFVIIERDSIFPLFSSQNKKSTKIMCSVEID
jgi:hypothetical protein